MPADDLAAIKAAMDHLLAYFGPRSDSARNIAEIKSRIDRSLKQLTQSGAAASLRKALFGEQNWDAFVILRLEDVRDNVLFSVIMHKDELLAGANVVSMDYYVFLDLESGQNRLGWDSDPNVDLLGRMSGDPLWTPNLRIVVFPGTKFSIKA